MVNVFVPAFSLALIYFRSLQLLGSHVRKKSPWYSRVSLDDDSRRNLLWWSSCSFPLPGSLLSPPFCDFSLTTDASLTGWSGILSSGELVSGIWSDVESSYHINLLELTAVYNSFLAFSDLLQGSRVQVFSDNYTTVSFLNKKGGTHSKDLCRLALIIWNLLLDKNISCCAIHIAGKLNIDADHLSRKPFSLMNTAYALWPFLLYYN